MEITISSRKDAKIAKKKKNLTADYTDYADTKGIWSRARKRLGTGVYN